MNCYCCQTELTWGGDFEVEDDDEFEFEINLSCPKCEALVIVYTRPNTEETNGND